MASAVIYAARTVSGNSPATRRLLEEATQSFLLGVPVQMDTATGGIQEWDGATITRGIAGISKEAGSSLTTTGVAKQVTFGSVPNQSAAVNIARPPFNDGKVGVEIANDDNIFFAQVGPAQTVADTDVGKYYGMTKDTDNHFFVDKTKATQGTNTVCVIVKRHDDDLTRGVFIRFQKEAQQEIT